jgi:hypothetical protein
MDAAKKRRLEAAGWTVGDAADLLGLTPQEVELVDVKLALGDYLRQLRCGHSLTQTQVAERIGSSQSRVAKMEAADSTVSLDLLVQSLFVLGASRQEVGAVIGCSHTRTAR